MPTGGEANLEIQRVVMVVALIEGLKIDFGHTIADEMFARAYKTSNALPFPCLITKLCRRANVPLISEVHNEVRASYR